MELSVQLATKDFRTSVGQSTDHGEDSRLAMQMGDSSDFSRLQLEGSQLLGDQSTDQGRTVD